MKIYKNITIQRKDNLQTEKSWKEQFMDTLFHRYKTLQTQKIIDKTIHTHENLQIQ